MVASSSAQSVIWEDFGSDCRPEEVGLDSNALAKLKPLLASWVASGRMPLASALVARHGKIAWWGGCGDQSPGRSISADTIYRVYSMTKPITSAAIMMLVEEGKITLQMPVHAFLGKAWRRKNMKVFVGGTKEAPKFEECKKCITVHHLLTHTSGLTYGFDGTEYFNVVAGMCQDTFPRIPTGFSPAQQVHEEVSRAGIIGNSYTIREYVDKLATLPLCYQPGTQWSYGLNLEVLSRIIEVVSGDTFDAFLEERIFKPLGMIDTSFAVPAGKANRFANCWYSDWSGGQVDITEALERSGDYVPSNVKFFMGGGGLVSTMRDYFCFAQCMLNGGVAPNGTRIISRSTVEWMATNHLPNGSDMVSMALPGYAELDSPGIGFGLGFSVMLNPVKARMNNGEGTFSWGGLAATRFYCDPVEQITVIFLTQVIGLDQQHLPTQLFISNIVAGAIVDGPVRTPSARSRL